MGPSQAGRVGPQAVVLAREIEERFQTAVQALPAPQREVLLLVVLEHLEPQEVAVMLGLKSEAVRARLARARATLRETLPDLVLEGDAA